MSGSWVTSTMVCPSRCSASNSARISSLVALSRLPVGSSARRMLGWFTSARAIATRCRWPPESSLGRCCIRSFKPDPVERVGRERAPLLGAHAGIDQRQLDVVQRGGAGQQVEGLEDEPDLLVADPGQLVVAQLRDPVAVEPVLALRSGLSRQPMRFISVDLPEPDGPMMATNSFFRMVTSTPRSACTISPPMS